MAMVGNRNGNESRRIVIHKHLSTTLLLFSRLILVFVLFLLKIVYP